ncbi:MAG: hypothetical protein M1815_005299 [Lichina confinis]|nr:MAG: hypothetical protein M1815_005299 [Lichina confinis]
MGDTQELHVPGSPLTVRALSLSPSDSPTPALSACPPLERSVSATSTTSTFSQLSLLSRSSETAAGRRRGYARPQGTCFADSARNRESVMSLGSIAHLQHYFARTGLLDGKGGQHQHGKIRKKSRPSDADFLEQESPSPYPGTPSQQDTDSPFGSVLSSPDVTPTVGSRAPSEDRFGDEFDDDDEDPDTMQMLPPTVSTYNPRPKHIPPPPNPEQLRRDLRKSLDDAKTVLQGATSGDNARGASASPAAPPADVLNDSDRADADPVEPRPASPSSEGWNQVQGLNILDTMTLAIRAAKMYYTAHEQPARLASFKSERKLREELLGVLDALKRMAVRNFAGGIKTHERALMLAWIDGVTDLLRHGEELEAAERAERQSWRWMRDDDWDMASQAREREWLFLTSFEPNASAASTTDQALPPWADPPCDRVTELPTPFLRSLQSGLRLVRLHNEMVRKSRKPFGQITAYHCDTLKPYRCADNLRYWIKAAELRWDITLRVDVLAIVYSRGDDAWTQLDQELLRWCAKVRSDLVAEWNEAAEKQKHSKGAENKGTNVGYGVPGFPQLSVPKNRARADFNQSQHYEELE